MRDRLSELHQEAGSEWNAYLDRCLDEGEEPEMTYDEFIADYLLENGVVVPLLQTGQTVYRVSKNRMWEVKIWKVEICGGTVSYIDNYDKSFLERHIGKGIFLTKEEAEQVLKGGVQE